MPTLILVTIIWAFSFSFIGVFLAPHVDAYVAVFIRMALALLLLLPFTRLGGISKWTVIKLMAIGGLQLGLMYLLLYHAFLYLTVPEVLLFTIFTPLYITLVDEWVLNRKPLPKIWWLAALLSVVGAGLIRYHELRVGVITEFMTGFLLIQGANLCFAIGQVAYKRLPLGETRQQIRVYSLFFLGAALVAGTAMMLFGDYHRMPTTFSQWAILLWLGLGASGGGYLAWSTASKKVNIGQLATMNNALIPAGILVNVLIWRHSTQWSSLLLGGVIIIFSIWLSSRSK